MLPVSWDGCRRRPAAAFAPKPDARLISLEDRPVFAESLVFRTQARFAQCRIAASTLRISSWVADARNRGLASTAARPTSPKGAGALPQSWRRGPFGRRWEWPEALFRLAQDGDRRATVAPRAAGSGGPTNECVRRQADRVARSRVGRRGHGLERTRTR